MNLRHTLHEKLADRFSFIQYPKIRPADSATRAASRTGLHFKTPMPLGKRIDLFLFSLLLLLAGAVAMTAVCVFAYCLLF